MFTKTLEVTTVDDWAECPGTAVIEFTPKDIARLLFLSKQVESLDVYCIQEFDNTPAWISADDNIRTECIMRKIYTDHVAWSGYLKHTSILFETERLSLKELKKEKV